MNAYIRGMQYHLFFPLRDARNTSLIRVRRFQQCRIRRKIIWQAGGTRTFYGDDGDMMASICKFNIRCFSGRTAYHFRRRYGFANMFIFTSPTLRDSIAYHLPSTALFGKGASRTAGDGCVIGAPGSMMTAMPPESKGARRLAQQSAVAVSAVSASRPPHEVAQAGWPPYRSDVKGAML